jgi:hypothetical protein
MGTILNRFSQDMTVIESPLAHGVLATISSKPLYDVHAALF